MRRFQRLSPHREHSRGRTLVRCLVIVAFCVAMAATLLCPDQVLARAGGGGGFGGGGGGGGGGGFGGGGGGGFSGGGGGSGGGGDLGWRGTLVIVAIVVFIVLAGDKTRKQHVTRTIRRGRQRQSDRLLKRGLDAIRARDPAFDPDQLLQRVSGAFHKIQHAWCAQDLSDVRPFISDGVFERFSLQVAMQQAEGVRDVMERITIHESRIAAVFSDRAFDTLHVHIRASAVDYRVSLESGRQLSGDTSPEEFVEIWSFHRRPGARSLTSPGAIEGNCPRCAAPLRIIDRAKCQACGALVNSGEFDWVLSEITQESEWHVPGDAATVPGLADLAARDPAFSIQHVEDRTSVMFWRLRGAEFYRNLDYVSPVVLPSYRQELAQSIGGMKLRSEYWKNPAVGRVETIDVLLAGDDGLDRVRVKVRWSGVYAKGDPAGESHELRRQAIYTHVYILARRHDVQSTPQSVFASAGCPSCGAPIAVNETGHCSYCGEGITDGRFDWVLESIQPYSANLAFVAPRSVPAGGEDRESEKSPPTIPLAGDDAELALAVLAKVMTIDGEISPAERRAMYRLGKHRRVLPPDVDLILDSAATEETKIPHPRTPQEATRYLDQLVHAVLVDGAISRGEQKLIGRYAGTVGLTSADVRLTIKRERRRLYAEAKEFLSENP